MYRKNSCGLVLALSKPGATDDKNQSCRCDINLHFSIVVYMEAMLRIGGIE